jgi:chromosome segregation ATPase
MLPFLLPLLPVLLSAALGYWSLKQHQERVSSKQEHTDEMGRLSNRATSLEESKHATDLRLVKIEAHAEANENRQLRLENDIRDVRDNMARREDIQALSDRIRDVLKLLPCKSSE